jgi:hypothetical protein
MDPGKGLRAAEMQLQFSQMKSNCFAQKMRNIRGLMQLFLPASFTLWIKPA